MTPAEALGYFSEDFRKHHLHVEEDVDPADLKKRAELMFQGRGTPASTIVVVSRKELEGFAAEVKQKQSEYQSRIAEFERFLVANQRRKAPPTFTLATTRVRSDSMERERRDFQTSVTTYQQLRLRFAPDEIGGDPDQVGYTGNGALFTSDNAYAYLSRGDTAEGTASDKQRARAYPPKHARYGVRAVNSLYVVWHLDSMA